MVRVEGASIIRNRDLEIEQCVMCGCVDAWRAHGGCVGCVIDISRLEVMEGGAVGRNEALCIVWVPFEFKYRTACQNGLGWTWDGGCM